MEKSDGLDNAGAALQGADGTPGAVGGRGGFGSNDRLDECRDEGGTSGRSGAHCSLRPAGIRMRHAPRDTEPKTCNRIHAARRPIVSPWFKVSYIPVS